MDKLRTERVKIMENMGNKKLALLYILQILKYYSDADHPLTQGDIAEKLENDYGIVIERKAVSRNLSLLREAGYEVESTAKGNYLDEREFDNTELRLMIDAVLSSRYITEKQAKDLAERIAGLSNKYFRSHVKHIRLLSGHQKTENKSIFYSLELIDEAIEHGKQISFDYYNIDEDLKYNKIDRITVSPIQLVVKNQFYYLLVCEEWNIFGRAAAKRGGCGRYPVVTCYRLDMIANPIIEDEDVRIDKEKLTELGEKVTPKDFLSTHPYMHSYGFATQKVSFLCYEANLTTVTETFGTDIKIKKIKPKGSEPGKDIDSSCSLVKVTLKTDINELIEFACRYPKKIFIVSPKNAADRQKDLYQSHILMAEKMREYDE